MRIQPTPKFLIALILVFAVCANAHSTRKQTTATKPATSKTVAAKRSPSRKIVSSKSTSPKRRTSARRTARLRMPAAPTPERISEIQSALAQKGLYQGSPTGRWDPATIDAMTRFQQSQGLDTTGKLDAPSLEKLGLGSQTSGVAAPLPQAKPEPNILTQSRTRSEPPTQPDAATDTANPLSSSPVSTQSVEPQ